MSPKIEPRTSHSQGNQERSGLQNVEELKQEVTPHNSENYTIINFPPIYNVGKHEYGEEAHMLQGCKGNEPSLSSNNASEREQCLNDITSLTGGTRCMYENNGLLTISPQVSNDQPQMLPPIGSISKHFHMQNEVDNTNLRNLNSSSVSTRRSSAKSAIVRGGKRALSASPLGEGVADLTSLIRCSPTSLLGFTSSSCSQVSTSVIMVFVTSLPFFYIQFMGLVYCIRNGI